MCQDEVRVDSAAERGLESHGEWTSHEGLVTRKQPSRYSSRVEQKETPMSIDRAYFRFRRSLLAGGGLAAALCGFVALMAGGDYPAWYFAHMMLWGASLTPLALLGSRWLIAYTAADLTILILYFILLGAHDRSLVHLVSILGIPIAAVALIHASALFQRHKKSGRIYAFVLARTEARLGGARSELPTLSSREDMRKRERLERRIRELVEDAEETRRKLAQLGISPIELRERTPRIHNPLRSLGGLESAIDSCKARLQRFLSQKKQL